MEEFCSTETLTPQVVAQLNIFMIPTYRTIHIIPKLGDK